MQASQALRSCSRLEPSALAIRLRSSSLSSLTLGPASQPLWSCCDNGELALSDHKAAAKQVLPEAKQRLVAQALACICVICGFSK